MTHEDELAFAPSSIIIMAASNHADRMASKKTMYSFIVTSLALLEFDGTTTVCLPKPDLEHETTSCGAQAVIYQFQQQRSGWELVDALDFWNTLVAYYLEQDDSKEEASWLRKVHSCRPADTNVLDWFRTGWRLSMHSYCSKRKCKPLRLTWKMPVVVLDLQHRACLGTMSMGRRMHASSSCQIGFGGILSSVLLQH